MVYFKQAGVMLAALLLATSAAASTQLPITASAAEIRIDASTALATMPDGYTFSATGGASYDSGTGIFRSEHISASLATVPGPIQIEWPDASGLTLAKGIFDPALTLSNLSFDSATRVLSGDLRVTLAGSQIVGVVDQALLVARTASTGYGFGIRNNPEVYPGTTPRDLYVHAMDFEVSDALRSYIHSHLQDDPLAVEAVLNVFAGTLQHVRVSPVPELSTWALMGIGLLGVGVIARRQRPA